MESLPDELLLEIFQYLGEGLKTWSSPRNHDSTRDVAAVSRVCKRFRRIVGTRIYESIDRPPIDNQDFALRRLLALLLEKPGLRSKIKSIRQKTRPDTNHKEFLTDHYTLKKLQPSVRDAREHLKGPVMALADELRLPYPHQAFRRRLYGEDILFTLLAFLAPDLECLWVRMPKCGPFPASCLLLEGISRSAFGDPIGAVHLFDKLKILRIDLVSIPEWPMSYALPLLLLPNLEDLTLGEWGGSLAVAMGIGDAEGFAVDDDDESVFGRQWVWPIRSSSVTRLSLLRPYVSPNMAIKMIRACKALQRFECTRPKTFSPEDDWFDNIVPALCQHAESLTELSIGLLTDDHHVTTNGSGMLDSLSDLKCLKSIRLPLYLLVDHDLDAFTDHGVDASSLPESLPQSIEHLNIHLPIRVDLMIDMYLATLRQWRDAGYFRSLQSVEITWRYEYNPSYMINLLSAIHDLMGERERYMASSVRFDIVLDLRFDNLTFDEDDYPLPSLDDVSEFDGLIRGETRDEYDTVDGRIKSYAVFTTCTGRRTEEEMQDDRDDGY